VFTALGMGHSFSQSTKTTGRGECGGKYQDKCRGTSSGGTSDDHTRWRAHAAAAWRRRKELRWAIVIMGGRYRRRRLLRQALLESARSADGAEPDGNGAS
jgi:hypothetical protein